MKFELTQTMQDIIKHVNYENGKIYIVGGAVRDIFMDKEPKDIDFCTDLTPGIIEYILDDLDIFSIPDKKAREHGIIRAVDKHTGELIDIATLRKDISCNGRHAQVQFTKNIYEDLNRRDFTINGMAVLVDENGWSIGTTFSSSTKEITGIQDIKNKIVRCIGDADIRFDEDALRMIRACRFTALSEDWKLSSITMAKCIEKRHLIKNISKERIRDEILKALSYDKPSNFFRNLASTKLLEIIIPDLAKGIGCDQNEYHSETVFNHLLRCLDASVELTNNPLLRLAALTHDIAKPHTKSTDKNGRVHFYKHEIVGAQIIYKWMKQYKFKKEDAEYVSKMVRHHQWRFENNTKDKTIRRWLQDVGKHDWEDLITLRCADRKGNLKKAHLPMVTGKMLELIEKATSIINSGDPIFKEDLAINGKDIQALGVKPGKIYKDIFSNMLGIVVADPSKNTKEWLSHYVTKNYVNK